MIYLNEYEGKSIEITYNGGDGRMTVNLMQFLDNQPLTKIRKLIDLIRVSDNPDAAATFKNYCAEWLKRYEPEQKVNANGYVNNRKLSEKCETELSKLISMRSRFKRKSEQYEHFNEQVKAKRDELSLCKARASTHLSDFKKNQRIKEKYEKVLDYINQGR